MKKIYSVSTKYYFAVGVLVSKDVAYKWKALNEVRAVIADCYVDRATKDYGGEPFVDGKPVPYDPEHHAFYHRVQEIIRDTSDMPEDSISDSICSTSLIGLRECMITDCRTSKVVVKGEKADPVKVFERVQRKSHHQVELISPIPKPPLPPEQPQKPPEK
ncbi:hypothetical protein OROMI_011575 [Orobanche minor]